MGKKIQLTETDLIKLIGRIINENENLFDGRKDDVKKILEDLGLHLNYDREQIRGYIYITLPKNGFEFNIWKLRDNKFSVKTSYYGTIYKTEETSDLMRYLSDTLKSKPKIKHK